MAQRVPFIVAELGRDADPFMLHLYAAFSRDQRRRLPTNGAARRGFKKITLDRLQIPTRLGGWSDFVGVAVCFELDRVMSTFDWHL